MPLWLPSIKGSVTLSSGLRGYQGIQPHPRCDSISLSLPSRQPDQPSAQLLQRPEPMISPSSSFWGEAPVHEEAHGVGHLGRAAWLQHGGSESLVPT